MAMVSNNLWVDGLRIWVRGYKNLNPMSEPKFMGFTGWVGPVTFGLVQFG